MALSKPTFGLNRPAAIVLVVIGIIVLGGGGWAGYALGVNHGKQQVTENPPKQMSIIGKVKAVTDKGLTVTAASGEWKVTYLKHTAFRAGATPIKKSDLKPGETVRIIGTLGERDKTLNAQTITAAALRPSPKPSPKPSPGK